MCIRDRAGAGKKHKLNGSNDKNTRSHTGGNKEFLIKSFANSLKPTIVASGTSGSNELYHNLYGIANLTLGRLYYNKPCEEEIKLFQWICEYGKDESYSGRLEITKESRKNIKLDIILKLIELYNSLYRSYKHFGITSSGTDKNVNDDSFDERFLALKNEYLQLQNDSDNLSNDLLSILKKMSND